MLQCGILSEPPKLKLEIARNTFETFNGVIDLVWMLFYEKITQLFIGLGFLASQMLCVINVSAYVLN